MISLERLLLVPKVDSNNPFDISPDGTWVVFSWNISGQWELYRIPITTTQTFSGTDQQNHPQPISPGTGSRFNPKFSPVNPQNLICAVDYDGSESFHLLFCDLNSKETLDLTPNDTLQPNFSWSPDGTQVAFISNRSGNFDAYILDKIPSECSQDAEDQAGKMPLKGHLVCTTGHPIWEVAWSPAGDWLAFSAETSGSDYGIYLVPITGGAAITLTENNIPINASHPCWSPDGRQLAFRATHSSNTVDNSSADFGYFDIGIYDLNTQQITWVSNGSSDKNSPVWRTGDGALAYINNKGAATSLVVQKNKSSANLQYPAPNSVQSWTKNYQVGTGFHAFPRFTPDGQNIIVLFESPRQPSDLWLISLENGDAQALTSSLPADIDKNDLVMPEEITYPGENGELLIPALLYRPQKSALIHSDDISHTSAVINIHGGPNWHYSLAWNPFMAHLANRGWTVLAPNYRGSTGYGRNWQIASYRDMGGCDARDISAGARYLIETGLADPEHIAVTGRSHGGFLSMACLTQFPELWAAGSGIAPFFDWLASHYASRTDLQHWNIQNMGDPVQNQQLWYERSPSNFLDRVNAPVQIICGGHDPRCPAVDSIAARDKLLALKKQVDFQLYPDEGHGFLKMENILDSEIRRVNFLARYL